MTFRLLPIVILLAAACSAGRPTPEKGTGGDVDDTDQVDDTDLVVDTDVVIDTDKPVQHTFQIASPTVGGGVVSSSNFRAVVRIAPPISVTHTTGPVQARPPLPLPASDAP